MYEYFEFVDIKADTLYILIDGIVKRITSPVPFAYGGSLKEEVESGKVAFIVTKKKKKG